MTVAFNDEEKYKRALDYARQKHKGQYRKGGEEYITHPIAVAELVKDMGIDYRITALFHDLLEDTDATEEEILKLGGPKVLEAVKLMTKTKGYVMSQYIAGIKSNPMAFAVKNADRLHNLRSADVASEAFRKKYIKETLEWYMDFSPEIREAEKALEKTLDTDITRRDSMNIIKKAEGTNLEIKLEGRLDTTTAPNLEREIDEMGDIKNLTFDFDGLEYISSAGLRVILKAQKLMSKKGNMKLINVNDDVMDVFDITGFADILTIE